MILSRREIPWLAVILVSGNLFAVGLASVLFTLRNQEHQETQTTGSSVQATPNTEFLESRLPARLPRAARMNLDEESSLADQPNFFVPLPPPMEAIVAPFKPMPDESPALAGQATISDGWPEDTHLASQQTHQSLRPGLNFSNPAEENRQTGSDSVASMLPSLNPRQPLAAEPHPQLFGQPSGSAFWPAAIPQQTAQPAALSPQEATDQPSLPQAQNTDAEQSNQPPSAKTQTDASHSAKANYTPEQNSLEQTHLEEIPADTSPSPSPTPRKRRQRPETEAKPAPSATPNSRPEPTQPRRRNVPPRKR